MDRRSLAFFIIVFLGITASNLYFSQKEQEERAKWVQNQALLKAENEQKEAESVYRRIAPKEVLPLVSLYYDKEGTQDLGFGVYSENSILVAAHSSDSKELPKRLYMRQLGSSADLTEVELQKTSNQVGAIAFYTRADQAVSFKKAKLPRVGQFDLQLVARKGYPEAAGALSPAICLAEWIDGEFNLPLIAPEDHAIALVRIEDSYVPLGIYDPESNRFSLIELEEEGVCTLVEPLQKALPELATEDYYILENAYQQLVFSTKGASLVEINLPFKSKDNASVVLPIEFDRQLVKEKDEAALFPAKPAYRIDQGKTAFLSESSLGGYYPLLRREIAPPKGAVPYEVPPRYYALNLVSDYPELSSLHYTVKEFDRERIVFEASQPHRRIRKTFYLDQSGKEAPYCFYASLQIEGDRRQMWLTSGVPDVEWISNAPAPQLKYRLMRKQAEVEKVDPPKDAVTYNSLQPTWLCNSNGFLGLIVDPLTDMPPGFRIEKVPGSEVPSRLVYIDRSYERFKPNDLPGYQMLLPLSAKEAETKLRIFAGPFAEKVLKTADATYYDADTQSDPDYMGCQSYHGWFAFLSQPIAKFFLWVMRFFYGFTGSWAFSIILLTCTLRLLLYPLNAWSFSSMRKMQQITPEVAAIQERYKKDPQKAQLETVALYRERGVNPISGCFPMLIQMPFLIGMFDLLKSTFELRGASFIPGWIDNLTAPDVLFEWNMPFFFIGNQFHLLPVLLGAVMFLQQKLGSTLPEDKSKWTEQQKQQNSIGGIMTAVFTLMFYHFPAGLNIYWLSSMLLSIAQQWMSNRLGKKLVVAPKQTK